MISLSWLSDVGRSIKFLVPGVGTLFGFVVFIYDLGEKILVGGLTYASESFAALDTSAFSDVSFASVAAIGYANTVFPIPEAMNIWASVFTACLSVSAIRWVKSFIPTLSN